MKKIYNVVRFKKVKTTENVTNVANHNFRRFQNLINVDYEKKSENVYLIDDENCNLNKKFEELKDRYKFKFTENRYNKFDEFIFSASQEFFENLTKDEQIQYFKDNIEILKKHYFKVEDSIVSAVIHFDELTAHCHVVCCPLVTTEKVVTKGKYKDQIKTTTALSHERVLGGRKKCRELQKVFYEELTQNYNYKFDEYKKHNKNITHTDIKDFYEEVNDYKNNKLNCENLNLDKYEDLKNYELFDEIENVKIDIKKINKTFKQTFAILQLEKKKNEELEKKLEKEQKRNEKQEKEYKEKLEEEKQKYKELEEITNDMSNFIDDKNKEIKDLKVENMNLETKISNFVYLSEKYFDYNIEELYEEEKMKLLEEEINEETKHFKKSVRSVK